MTSAQAERIDRHVLNLLVRQRDLYVELRNRAQEQRSMIDCNDADGLLKLLSDRQKLVDRLAELNDMLVPMRRRWDSILSAMTVEGRRHSKSLVTEVNELLASILQNDAKDSQVLSTRREAIGSELKRTTSARQANMAYSAVASSMKSSQPRFFDQTDE